MNKIIQDNMFFLKEFKKFLKEKHIYKEFKIYYWKYNGNKFKDFSIKENPFDYTYKKYSERYEVGYCSLYIICTSFPWYATLRNPDFWVQIHIEWFYRCKDLITENERTKSTNI